MCRYRAGEQELSSSEGRGALLTGHDSLEPATCGMVLATHRLPYLSSIRVVAAVQSDAREGQAVPLIQFQERAGTSQHAPCSGCDVPQQGQFHHPWKRL